MEFIYKYIWKKWEIDWNNAEQYDNKYFSIENKKILEIDENWEYKIIKLHEETSNIISINWYI